MESPPTDQDGVGHEILDGGMDGTRTRGLRRDRPAFWTN